MIDSFRLEIAIASLSFASLLSLETRLAAALAQVLTPCLMSVFVAENSSMSEEHVKLGTIWEEKYQKKQRHKNTKLKNC